MEEEEIEDYPMSDIDNLISKYKTQFDLIKKCSIEQITKSQKKFDLNEQFQKDNDKQASYIKTLKSQIAIQENEIGSLKDKVESLNNLIITLNTTIQDKEKEYQKIKNNNDLSTDNSVKTLIQQYHEKETALSNTITDYTNNISNLKNKVRKWDQIKQRIVRLHEENKPLMIKAIIIKDESIKEEDMNKEGKEKEVINDDIIIDMINNIKQLMSKLIEENKEMNNQVIQYQKNEEEQKKKSETLKELKYENGMLKQQINQLVNDNLKQIPKEKNEIYYKTALQNDYATKEIKYIKQTGQTYNQSSLYKSDLNPIIRLKSKIKDLEERLRSRKVSQEIDSINIG